MTARASVQIIRVAFAIVLIAAATFVLAAAGVSIWIAGPIGAGLAALRGVSFIADLRQTREPKP
ncbi:MAG: hypothetical protein AAFQ67_06190 [Pseudomonadota bacterium]